MATIIPTGLRIKRPLITANGSVSWIDPTVRFHLEELNGLLEKRLFERDGHRPDSVPAFLKKELEPKRSGKQGANSWGVRTTARFLSGNEDPRLITISEHIDSTSEIANLKYAFQTPTASFALRLNDTARAIIDEYDGIVDYLIAYAYYEAKLVDAAALGNFILEHPHGINTVLNYAVVSAARDLISKEQLNVPDYDNDKGDLAQALRVKVLPISAAAFGAAARAIIDNLVFNSDEAKLIKDAEAKVGTIPDQFKPQLIKLIQHFPIKLDNKNIDLHLPVLIAQASRSLGVTPPEDSSTDVADQDFDVQFQDEQEPSTTEVSSGAVRCTAQLYHGMVVGDELDVFGIMDYFTHKYLLHGDLEIRDKRLRSDLRMYVFSEKFIDLETNRIMDRTHSAERRVFYRQVFNEGRAETTDEIIPNAEFTRLWKVFILESAKYLQRAQASYYPDLQSKQNVMQAVEDLRYNLSTTGTGLVNVISPIIDGELNFILKRVLDHTEVRQNVVPRGGGWQRVVETLGTTMKRSRVRASTLYNKAKLGEKIIRAMADYSPATFEGDTAFSSFISLVDAFISTQSILQESLKRDLMKDEDQDSDEVESKMPLQEGTPIDLAPEHGASPAAMAGVGAGNGQSNGDEWDF